MTKAAPIHHAIDYIEITANDLPTAMEFYSAAFGWTFNSYGPGYAGIVRNDGGESGGICEGKAAPGGPLVILYSSDLEASLQSVLAAGGTIEKELFSFPGGSRFEFADPSGNRLGVWTHE